MCLSGGHAKYFGSLFINHFYFIALTSEVLPCKKIGDIPNTRADSNGEFTDGNVAGGVPPTLLPAEWFNTIQRELVTVVQDGGLTLDPNDDTQVLAALKSYFAVW